VASCCVLVRHIQHHNSAAYQLIPQLYDFLLTLGEEMDLVWETRWNLGKVLFFATRYPPLLDAAMLLYRVYTFLLWCACQ
jgi:Family of unknown function (DUF6533)